MFCEQCGKELGENAKFCKHCGARCIEEVAEAQEKATREESEGEQQERERLAREREQQERERLTREREQQERERLAREREQQERERLARERRAKEQREQEKKREKKSKQEKPSNEKPSKEGIKKWQLLAGLIAAVLLVSVVVAGFLFFRRLIIGKVEFQDPLVERCVRLTLDKDADEAISKKECASIEELLIDCDLDISITVDYYTAQRSGVPANYIDLSDLQYLTGLKELVIDNNIHRDILVNLDAVSGCKQLEEWTMKYNPVQISHFGMPPMGYKYLAGIVQQLPKLDYLNLGYPIAQEHKEFLAGENRDIRFAEEGTHPYGMIMNTRQTMEPVVTPEEYEESWAYKYDGEKLGSATIVRTVSDAGELEDFIESLPKTTEDIFIRYTGEDAIDLEIMTRFKHLKTLTIIKNMTFMDDIEKAAVEVEGLETLADNKELFALNLCGVTGNFEEIGRLSGLRELTLLMCVFEKADFLGDLEQLQELAVLYNECPDLEDYLEDNGEALKNLKFLRVDYGYPSDYKGIDKVPKLEALSILYKGAPESVKHIAKCQKLSYISMEIMDETFDMGDFEKLETLRYVFVGSNRPLRYLDGVEKLATLPNIVSMVLPYVNTSDRHIADMAEWSETVIENPQISCFIPDCGIYMEQGAMMLQGQLQDIFYRLYDEGIFSYGLELLMLNRPEEYSTMDAVRTKRQAAQ